MNQTGFSGSRRRDVAAAATDLGAFKFVEGPVHGPLDAGFMAGKVQKAGVIALKVTPVDEADGVVGMLEVVFFEHIAGHNIFAKRTSPNVALAD